MYKRYVVTKDGKRVSDEYCAVETAAREAAGRIQEEPGEDIGIVVVRYKKLEDIDKEFVEGVTYIFNSWFSSTKNVTTEELVTYISEFCIKAEESKKERVARAIKRSNPWNWIRKKSARK